MNAIYGALFIAGIIFGHLMYRYEERPANITVRIKFTKDAEELAETETFLAVLNDDTQDDIRLKQYKPVKAHRNRPPLMITAMPHATTANMARIRVWMLENVNRQHTKVMSSSKE